MWFWVEWTSERVICEAGGEEQWGPGCHRPLAMPVLWLRGVGSEVGLRPFFVGGPPAAQHA